MDKTYAGYVSQAELFKQIGQTDIYLYSHTAATLDGLPWEHVTEVAGGGSHRLEMYTDVRFSAVDPCGLNFSWCCDMEPRSANGSGHYQFDTDLMSRIANRLKPDARAKFAVYLTESVEKLRAKGSEWQGYADRQNLDANAIEAVIIGINHESTTR